MRGKTKINPQFQLWGLTFESDSTLMFYIGETVEILMKKGRIDRKRFWYLVLVF